MTARSDTVTGLTPRRGQLRQRRVFVFGVPLLLVLLSACTADSQDVTLAQGTPTPTVEEVVATTAPAESPTVTATTPSQATSNPAGAPLLCDDVPAFQAADTVSIACSGSFAVSPELFASNAALRI